MPRPLPRPPPPPPRGIPDWMSSYMGFSQHDERSHGTSASERSSVGKGMHGWSDSESETGGKYQLKSQVAISGAASSFRRKRKAGETPPAASSQSAYLDDHSRKAKESAPKEKTAEGDVETDAKDKEVLIDISKDNPGVGDEQIVISSSTEYVESSPAAPDCGEIASVGGQGLWWPHTNAYWAGVAAQQNLAHQRLLMEKLLPKQPAKLL